MPKKLTSHIEDYLEMIYLLEKEHGHAHVRDIAGKMKIKMPSVTEILRKLKGAKLVNYQKYEFVTLTRKGSLLAQSIYSRHKILYNFLRGVLGVDEDIAEEDACKIEHVVSPQTLSKLKKYTRH
ncbi:MAG: metal-dependent transcriptional regulator [Candidatus Margulisiibacteriota bacterium]|nr:metal-dependent transcriptional regulator [Candidatus Margulisiibacteriota bacterium]